jgi:hypothetical protein
MYSSAVLLALLVVLAAIFCTVVPLKEAAVTTRVCCGVQKQAWTYNKVNPTYIALIKQLINKLLELYRTLVSTLKV